MQNFEKESAKMDMSEELLNDTLDDALGGSEDEAEADNVRRHVTRDSMISQDMR